MPGDGRPAWGTEVYQVPRTAVMWRLHMHTIVSRAPCAAGRARGRLGGTYFAACCCRYRLCACCCVLYIHVQARSETAAVLAECAFNARACWLAGGTRSKIVSGSTFGSKKSLARAAHSGHRKRSRQWLRDALDAGSGTVERQALMIINLMYE